MGCGCRQGFYQFQAGDPRVDASQLPKVCLSCGHITVGGIDVPLPEMLENQALELAKHAVLVSEAGAVDLERMAEVDLASGDRIKNYLGRYYIKAYLDGFFRALAFFQHHNREGRRWRLRQLWFKAVHHDPERYSVISMEPDDFAEFEKLLGATIDSSGIVPDYAANHQNQCPPGSKSRPSV